MKRIVIKSKSDPKDVAKQVRKQLAKALNAKRPGGRLHQPKWSITIPVLRSAFYAAVNEPLNKFSHPRSVFE